MDWPCILMAKNEWYYHIASYFLSVWSILVTTGSTSTWSRRCRRRSRIKGGTKTSPSSLRKHLDVEASRRQSFESGQKSRYAKKPPIIQTDSDRFFMIVPEVGISPIKVSFQIQLQRHSGCAGRESRFPPRSAKRANRTDLAVSGMSRSMSCQAGRNTLGGCQRRRHAVCCGAGMRDKKCVVIRYETP